MKRILFIILATVLCLSLFSGCATKKEFCYVGDVTEDGFFVDLDDVEGTVFVKYENAQQRVRSYTTVLIEYSSFKLKKKSGSIVVGKYTCYYSYVLEEVKNLRLSDPSKGEPLYG